MPRVNKSYLLLAILLLGSLLFGGASANKQKSLNSHKLIESVVRLIEKHYVEEKEVNELTYAACEGVADYLDDYTQFLRPRAAQDLEAETAGEFGGVGIEVTVRNKWLTVITPIEGAPAFKAGVRAGDIIYKINGKKTRKMTLNDAVELLRGKKGEAVTITVYHQGESEPEDITIVRDIVRVKSIPEAKIIDTEHNIGYIRLTKFQEKSAKDLRTAVDKMVADGMTGLILDLRFNPGGLLSSAIDISDIFIDKGVIVSTRGRRKSNYAEADAKAENTYTKDQLKLVIMINPYSASASEIVAGAVKDHKRGILVGEKSFGKGSVQSIIDIPNYLNDPNGAPSLKLTTAKYYTPSGVSIHGKGVEPHIKVAISKEEELKVVEQRRKRYIDQTSQKQQSTKKSPAPKKDAEAKDSKEKKEEPKKEDKDLDLPPNMDSTDSSDKPGDEISEDDIPDTSAGKDKDDKDKPFVDRQLERAIDTIKTMDVIEAQLEAKSDDKADAKTGADAAANKAAPATPEK